MRIGILGPNGSGKSTIIRLLLKIINPSSGMIFYDDVDITRIAQKDLARLLSYVPQMHMNSYAYPADELIAMGRYPHGRVLFHRETRRDREVIEDIITRLDLAALRTRPVSTLSGGEFQRVLLARALVQQTPLLLLDEPTNHLDMRHQFVLLEMIKQEQKRRELTVISVFHDLNLAIDFSDRILFLKDGELAAWDTSADFALSPALEQVYQLKFSAVANPFSTSPHLIAGLPERLKE